MPSDVALIHPGSMGSFLGSAVAAAGNHVRWASADRSAATRARAAGFEDAGTMAQLVAASGVVLSVCPPGAALQVAHDVAAAGFQGLYVDLNADSPQTVEAIAGILPRVVDGGIIGGPSSDDAMVWLAGPEAELAAELFAPDVVRCKIIDGPLGSASALKACYAASTKAVTALLLTVRAAARTSGVEDELLAEWERTQPGQVERSDRTLSTIGAKAWRFGGEMTEAAAYFDRVGASGGFSAAATEVYDRLADLRVQTYEPADVLSRLIR